MPRQYIDPQPFKDEIDALKAKVAELEAKLESLNAVPPPLCEGKPPAITHEDAVKLIDEAIKLEEEKAGDEAIKLVDEVFGPVEPGAPESPHAIPGGVESDAPPYEVKTYSDGTVVSGPGPMPDLSPAQQDAAELVQIEAAQNQPDAPEVDQTGENAQK